MAYDDDIISQIRIRAVDETGDVMRDMSKRIRETTESFTKLAFGLGGAELARRSFESYAELTRVLERLKFTTKASDEQMSSLGETFDEVAKRTGRSTDEIAKSFQEFYILTGQQYGPALEKMFKTISEASQVTGTSLESLSRIAGAAINNMKVPQEQMDVLIKKLAIDLPGSLESFAQMAPRVTESLNNIGLTGAKNAEEAALAFNALNVAFGNTRLSASAINEVLNQLYDGSTMFGKIMKPTLMDIRKYGGDVTDTFESMYKKLDAMHAFDPSTDPAMLKILGLDANTIKAIKIWHDSLDVTKQKLKESADAGGEFGDRLKTVSRDPLAAINELKTGLENVKNTFGELMVEVGASEALKGVADTFNNISNAIRYMEGHEKLKESSSEDTWASIGSGAGAAVLGAAGFAASGPLLGVPAGVVGMGAGGAAGRWAYRKSHGLDDSTSEHGSGFNPGSSELSDTGGTGFNKRFGNWPPKMAEGGIVTKPTIAEIGENGAEAVVPLGGGTGGNSTKDNTEATKDNTNAINRMSAYMRSTNRRGIYAGAGVAYTPGAGETPTPAEAGIFGGGEHGGAAMYRPGVGPRAHPGGGALYRPGVGPRREAGASGGMLGGSAETASTTNLQGNEVLAHERQPLVDEIENDPSLKEDVFKMAAMEESKGVPRTATMEALFNRVSMIRKHNPNYSIRNELHSGFYGPINRGGLNRPISAGSRATSASAYDAAKRGSNLIIGRTDQGAIGDPNAAGPGRVRVPGTSGIYNYWQGSRGGHHYSHEESAEFAAGLNQRASTANSPQASSPTDTNTVMKLQGHEFPFSGGGTSKPSGSVFDQGTSGVSHLDQHRAMREEMERPIKMAIEAPQPPPLYSYRQRMARQQSRYQSDDMLGAPRYASQIDIGFA
jgi:hypothetical protein